METATLEKVNVILRPATAEDILKPSIFNTPGKPKKMVLKYGQSYFLKKSHGTSFDNQPYLINTDTQYKDLKQFFDQRRLYVPVSNLEYEELETAFAKAQPAS